MASPFRPAIELLARFAGCHRDRRNIATHLVGVPMVVFSLAMLLARPVIQFAGWIATPAWLAFVFAALWYLTRGALGLGLATALGIGGLVALAHGASAASGGAIAWLACATAVFVAGNVAQMLGHYYEGRRPATATDPSALLAAPMFVVLELLASFGLFRDLAAEIDRRAGPTMVRDLAQPVAR